MFSWIATRLFYAVVFFFLGAWTASMSPNFRAAMRHASHVGAQSFDKMRDWTSSTLITTPDTAPHNVGAPLSPQTSSQSSSQAPAQAPAPVAAAAPAANVASPAPSAATAAAPEDLLPRARQAYANNDIVGAINAYRAYIDRNPNSIEARGELGNVYFADGRKHDAAQIYSEAAMKQLAAGDLAGARALLPAVRQSDAAMADDLEKRLAEAQANKN